MEKQRKPTGFNARRHLTDKEKEYVLKHYSYDPKTGEIFSRYWKRPIGYLNELGYIKIVTPIGCFFAHRLAWLLYYKEEPRQVIDHINRCKTDNRISNLRDVSQWENTLNRVTHYNRQTGIVGVCLRKSGRKRFCMCFHNRNLLFYTIDDAVVFRIRHGLAL